MLNQLRSSYQYWNHPIFTKPKGAIRPPQKSTISYKQATHFRDFAESYFSSQQIDASEIRLRKPPDDIADISSIIEHPFEAMRIASEKASQNYQSLVKSSSVSPITLQLRSVAHLMKYKEYDLLLQKIDQIIQNNGTFPTILFPIYGYIASICKGSEGRELKYIQEIENFSIDFVEQKHFYHLFDEISAISCINDIPILLQLFIGDTDDVAIAVSSAPHILPILTTNNSFLLSLKLNSSKKIFDSLIYTKYQAARNLPELVGNKDDDQDIEEK